MLSYDPDTNKNLRQIISDQMLIDTGQAIHIHVHNTSVRIVSEALDLNPLTLSLVKTWKNQYRNRCSKPPIIRALNIKDNEARVQVADLTAGFGQDSLCIAAHGHPLVSIEQNQLIASILKILVQQCQMHAFQHHWQVIHACSVEWLNQTKDHITHAVMDPFFHKKNSALPKNDMQWLKKLNANTSLKNDTLLFEAALEKVRSRLVVKRDRKAHPIAQKKPNQGSIIQKTTRFDCYKPV